jgi:hypothetical protein
MDNIGNTAEDRYRYSIYSLQVPEAGKSYPVKFQLDKKAKRIVGINANSGNYPLLYTRGTQKVEISGDELLPEDFAASLMMFGTNTPGGERFFPLGNVLPGNGELKILYKDKDLPSEFAPYEVVYTVKYE